VPVWDDTRAHRADVDARLFGEPKRLLAVRRTSPRRGLTTPNFLSARDTALAASAVNGEALATDVGINKMSTRIDCVLPNPGRRGCR